MPQDQNAPSIDTKEVAKFTAMADGWWDEQGAFKPLHKFNPVRVGYIKEVLVRHFSAVIAPVLRSSKSVVGSEAKQSIQPASELKSPMDRHGPEGLAMTTDRPLHNLSILDVGCGGGLLSEPLARLGATMKGIDASEKNIAIASAHAKAMNLPIDYQCISVENLAATGAQYDVVLAMEVVEHVADVESFLKACGQLVKPDGLMLVATLNRTLKSFALAIVGAEYILRWLPRGTHEWEKFLRPSELVGHINAAGIGFQELQGVSYNPLTDEWKLSDDVSVNYMVVAKK